MILTTMANYDVNKFLIDNESSANVLLHNTFVKMNLALDRLRRISTPLYRFDGNSVSVEEKTSLLVTIGTNP